jgi:putative transposase
MGVSKMNCQMLRCDPKHLTFRHRHAYLRVVARALRIERPDGRYHVTARGNERKSIFRDDRDRAHFLDLLEELSPRHGLQVHAFVLMDNHYHLMLQTPEANLSRTMQWLNVSYGVWFNRRHGRSGHLFQGRFKAVVVEDDSGWQEVARYVHLNPVRVAALSLDKHHRSAARLGVGPAPPPELVAERLALLRNWKWSSYRAYAGYGPAPDWLHREPVGRLCGGRTRQEQQQALRHHTEEALRQGIIERPWDRLVAGIVLGSQAFAQRLRQGVRGNPREQPELKRLGLRVEWPKIAAALERAKGRVWHQLCDQHGDWGRDAGLWLGRRMGRLTLRELGELAGGMDYAAVAQAVSRFGKRLGQESEIRDVVARIEQELSYVEM